MADTNWLQVALGAFGGATIGSITGFLSGLYFTTRKEKYDRQVIANQRQAEYHLKRRENLAKSIAFISEARMHYEDMNLYRTIILKTPAKIVNNSIETDYPGATAELLNKYMEHNTLATRALTNAMIESDIYGQIPSVYNLRTHDIGYYFEATLYWKLREANHFEATDEETTEANKHLILFIQDLRTLMDVELNIANSLDPSERTLRKGVTNLPLTYLPCIAPKLKLGKIDPAALNYDHTSER